MNSSSANQLLQGALALHRMGNLRAAMDAYVKVLTQDPENVEALYYVAVVAVQEGQYPEGIRLAQRALTLGPPQPRLHNLMGQTYFRLGQAQQALESYDRAIALQPDFADAHGNRANVLADLGRLDEALASYDRALMQRPDSPEDWNNRGTILRDLNRLEEALASFDRAIALRPIFAEAHFNRANILKDLRRMDEALAGYQRAIELQPNFADAHINRALALSFFYRHGEALASIERALALRRNDFDTIVNHANILRILGRLDFAEAEYQRALGINPNSSAPYLGRANVLLERGQYQEARAAAEQARALAPNAPEPLNTIAFLQLLVGEWKEGWKNFEARGLLPNPAFDPLPYPRWQGEPLPDERLVILAEQGMGDAIHFSRLAPILAENGYNVTVLTSTLLARLLSSLSHVKVATSTQELISDARPFRWVPMMSLPRVMGIQPTTVPAQVPYLSADQAKVRAWADRLGSHGFKIGICWKSGPFGDPMNRKRDIPLAEYAPLADIPGVRLITLQLGPGLDEINQVSFRDRIERVDDALRDWSDTAALMMNVDLVVTCDTSVPHLAGALARPTFIALPQFACWRWQLDREDSPWYPTMRLFRQEASGNWSGVLDRITQAVRATISAPPIPSPPPAFP